MFHGKLEKLEIRKLIFFISLLEVACVKLHTSTTKTIVSHFNKVRRGVTIETFGPAHENVEYLVNPNC